MTQLLVALGSFVLLPIMIRKKFKLSTSLLTVAFLIAILSGLPMDTIFRTVIGVFTKPNSRDTILTVLMVGILGGVMKHYGLLQKVVDALLNIISSKKIILMIIPSMIGLMAVPGGAILSAPFINTIGEEVQIERPRRAVINLIFRHISMMVLPFTTSLLFIRAALPDINIYKVVGYGFIFVASTVFLGYTLFIKDIKTDKIQRERNILGNIIKFLIYTSPIYLSVVINAITGLPFFISMIFSIFAAFLLSNKTGFINQIIKGININTILIVVSILLLKDIILQLDKMLLVVENVLLSIESGIGILLIFALVSIVFGFITGYPTSSLAITLPMLGMMSLPENQVHIYAYFLLVLSFLGYFFSPLHLCQVLTIGEMRVATDELYKEYRKYAPLQFLVAFASTLILLWIVK